MSRKFIDCREYPSAMNCTVAISADSDQELLDAAVQHAVMVHGHQDTPEFRDTLRKLFKEEPEGLNPRMRPEPPMHART